MKTLLTILFSLALVLCTFAQDEEKITKSELKKLMKEQREVEKQAEMEKMAELTKNMITQQQFVLEADYLSVNGRRIQVSPIINFVMVDSSLILMQDGIPINTGTNGVGGTTHEGRLLQYEYKTIGKKEESYNVLLSFFCPLGNHVIDISININPSGYANARANNGSVYQGKLAPLTLSRVYKGLANCRPHSVLK